MEKQKKRKEIINDIKMKTIRGMKKKRLLNRLYHLLRIINVFEIDAMPIQKHFIVKETLISLIYYVIES